MREWLEDIAALAAIIAALAVFVLVFAPVGG
mgnify:CR=1 FL=1